MRSCVGFLRRGGCWRRWGRWILGCMGLRGNGTTEWHGSVVGVGITKYTKYTKSCLRSD